MYPRDGDTRVEEDGVRHQVLAGRTGLTYALMMFSNSPGIGWITFGGRPRLALTLVLATCILSP